MNMCVSTVSAYLQAATNTVGVSGVVIQGIVSAALAA